MKFNNKTAIVTGAAKGIGRATAIRLAADGAKVAVLDLDQEKVDAVAEEITSAGGTAIAMAVDITKNDKIKEAVQKTIDEFEKIDILVNCAGAGWHNQPEFKDMPEDSWKWIIELNVNGTMFFTHSVLDHMIANKYGRIINITSIAGKTGIPNLAVYSASKGAIDSFTKSMAMELGKHNITVNSVSPGLVTDAEESSPSDGTFLGRIGIPKDIAPVIAFLASDEASYVTGADYVADGGRSLGPKGIK